MRRGALILAVLCAAPMARAQFTYRPAGELVTGSGRGRADMTNYAIGMRFPLESGPAYANSQVWGRGGGSGPGGGQCDTPNYAYPWRDNYCESRSWDMPMCPSGTGHQGQDIRPATCRNDTHWCVAAATGTVTQVGSYTVYITTATGVRYDYLHMGSVQVRVGDRVIREQRIGRVSNQFGGTPTTYHLHFNIVRAVDGFGMVYAPPYGALVDAYQRLLISTPEPDAGVRPDVVVPRDVVTATDVVAPRDVVTATDVVAPRDVVTATDVVAPRDVVTARDVVTPRDVVTVPDVVAPTDDVVMGVDAAEDVISDDSADPPTTPPVEAGRGCGCSTQNPLSPRGMGAMVVLAGALSRRRRRRQSSCLRSMR